MAKGVSRKRNYSTRCSSIFLFTSKMSASMAAPISKNIKKQMRAQMKADENVMYWTDVYGLS